MREHRQDARRTRSEPEAEAKPAKREFEVGKLTGVMALELTDAQLADYEFDVGKVPRARVSHVDRPADTASAPRRFDELLAKMDAVRLGERLPVTLAKHLAAELDADLSDVRVHTGVDAAQLAASIGARALAIGSDIYFAAGAYDPDSLAGIEMIAREVAHVAQQQRAAPIGARTSDAAPAPKTAGLDHILLGHVVTIADMLALDPGAIEIVVDGRARTRLAAAGVRGLQEGQTIYLHPDVYAPETEDGRYLLAHELVHFAQRRLAGGDERAAEAEATSMGRAYARGEKLRAPIVGLGSSAAHEDPAPESDKLLVAPPKMAWTVSPVGVRFRPKGATKWIGGLDKKLQSLAIVLQAFVGSAYTPELLRGLIATKGSLDAIYAGNEITGQATQDEAVSEFNLVNQLALDIVAFAKSRKLNVALTPEQLDTLQAGIDAADSWDVMQPELPGWMTEFLYTGLATFAFKTLLMDLGRAVRAQRDAASDANQQALVSARDKLLDKLAPPINAMEAIRADPALPKMPAYRVLFDLPGVDAKANVEVAVAPADAPAPFKAAFLFLTDALADASLAAKAPTSAAVRKQMLERYATRNSLRSMPRDGDSLAADGVPGKPTRDPLPSQLTSYPQLEPPFFDSPLGGDREFLMQISFEDVFEAFRGYRYKWELIHIPDDDIAKVGATANDRSKKGAFKSQLDVLGGRLSRDIDYGTADLARVSGLDGKVKNKISAIAQLLGPAGIGATTLVGTNNSLRMIGTVLKTILETLVKPRNEKTMPFGDAGLYVVRCIAFPQPSDSALIDHAASVSWLPVWVRPAHDMAQLHAQRMDLLAAGSHTRLGEIEQELANPDLKADDRKALEAEKARILLGLSGKGEDTLALERDQLNEALKSADGFQREQIEKRLKEIDTISKMRGDRLSGASTDGTLEGVTRIGAAFVGDDAKSIRPLFEVFQKPSNGTSFVYHAVDSTTQNSGHRDGDGDSREEAIVDAIKNILESDQGYGRGYVTLSIPHGPGATTDTKRTIRIEKSLGSLMAETLDNIAMIASIAAIAAAPFTGGASLALLVPIGIVGAIPSAYRLIDRAEQGTLRFDMATAMDVVNILGAAVGASQAVAGSRAALTGMQLGRGWMILGLGADGLGMLVAGAGMLDQIDELQKDPNMPPGLRNAMIMQIVGQQLIQLGLAVGVQLSMHGKTQAEGFKKAKDVVELAPLEPHLREEFAAKLGAKVDDVQFFRDTQNKLVGPNDVEIHYELDGYGLPTDLRVVFGSAAGGEHVNPHAKAASIMLEYRGFIGFLRDAIDRAILAFRGESKPKSGSRAWEARIELQKLPDAVAQVYNDVRAGTITPDAARSRLDDLQTQMRGYEQAIYEKGAGKGYIAAHDEVTKLAVSKGYPTPPKDHFYFEKPDGTYQLQRNPDTEELPKHVELHDGVWTVHDGAAPPAADMTMVRHDVAAHLGVPDDQVVLKPDGTSDTPIVTQPAQPGDPIEVHHKPGATEEALVAAADQARDKQATAKSGADQAADWVADVGLALDEEGRARWKKMVGTRSPEKVMAEYGGDLKKAVAQVQKVVGREGRATTAAAATAKASEARRAEMKQFATDSGLVNDPRVEEILDKLGDSQDPKDLANAAEKMRNLVVSEFMAAEARTQNPGARIFTEVQIWVEQTPEGAAKLKRERAAGETAAGIKEINGKVFKEITDMDLIVAAAPADGGPATVLEREEIKAGLDSPASAADQLDKGTTAVREAVRDGRETLLIKNGVDVTKQIDVTSIGSASAETRGPEGRGFQKSLKITVEDLNRLADELLRQARTQAQGTK